MRPADVAVEDVHCWVTPALARRRRVLEVGCGAGDLARQLGADGFEVTALDVELDEPAEAPGVTWIEADFLAYVDDPFDAVLFTRSLHHIHALERAIDHAARLLRPGALLLVDDFDHEAPDLETARWYYEALELLAAAGVYTHDRIEGLADQNPVDRWRAEHRHKPPLHAGGAMIGAIADRFTRVSTRRGPYLYRSIASGLEPSQRGAAVAEQVYGAESRRLQAGALVAVGLRITGVAPP
ncbi:MAG TPA: class I SAM-dependent methyltransferase [Kofleriaceae bacterium]|nr:class I SAM-dependent methyltransferase [Kofleriaceae bacterium]